MDCCWTYKPSAAYLRESKPLATQWLIEPCSRFNKTAHGGTRPSHGRGRTGEIISPHGQRWGPQHIPGHSGSTVDAKPLWAALYQSLNLMHAEGYEYRRLSIWGISNRCDK